MENKTDSHSLNKTYELVDSPMSAYSSGDSPVTVITLNSPRFSLDNLQEILAQLPTKGNLSYLLNFPLSEEEISQLCKLLSWENNFQQIDDEQAILPKKIYYPKSGHQLYLKENAVKIASAPLYRVKKTKKSIRKESDLAIVNSILFSNNNENSKKTPIEIDEVIGITHRLNEGMPPEKLRSLLGYATRLAKIGSWEVNLDKNTIYLSTVGFEILEKEDLSPLILPHDIDFFKLGKDREIIWKAIKNAIRLQKSFDAELRIITSKGIEKWVKIIGECEVNEGKCTRLFGSIQDIDNIKRVQIKLAKKTQLMSALTEIEGILLEQDQLWVKIRKCLQKIGELLLVDRVYFFEYGKSPSSGEQVISQRMEWVADGATSHIADPEMTNIPVSVLGDLIHHLMKNETQLLEINSMSNVFLQNVFNDQNIRQAVLAPININQNFFGFIGCDQCAESREWTEEEYSFLERTVSRIAAEIESHEANQKILYKSRLIQTNAKVVELLFKNENWKNAIDGVLKLMGETVMVDRVYYFQSLIHPKTKELYSKLLYEWTNGKVPSDLSNPEYQYIRLADHPEFLEKVLLGKPFSFLSRELEGATRAILDQSHIKSILQIPLFKFGEFSGYLGFDDCFVERIWSGDEISFLKSTTSNLSIAMERKEHVSLINKSGKEKNDILESIGDAFFTLDHDGKVTYWNKKANELLQLHKEGEVLEKNWYFFDVITDPVFLAKFHETNRTKGATTFETHYTKAGAWFEVNLYPSINGVTAYLKDVSEKKKSAELITQSNERYDKLTEATNDAIYDWDMTTNSVFMGKGFKTLFGYEYLQEPYSFDIWQDRIHPEDRFKINSLMEQVITDMEGSGSYQSEYRYRMKNGEYTHVIDRGMIIRNKNNIPVRLIGAIQDISYRKTYEESLKLLNLSLQDRARQLSISNSELEQFAFVVSHDLQEPLRMVTSFLTQLDRKYGDDLDEKAKTYIWYAVDGAKRMREIILDLLEFSTVGKQEETLEEVKLDEIMEEVQDLLRKSIETSETIIKINPLPVIRGYRNPLIQVMTNLIDNALKYRKKQDSTTVTVTANLENGQWVISVADNGIGIEEEYFENIFVIFKKLHPKDAYEGTGMGLALVKKIIENWGGQIWLESTLHEGSTFYFTIPINEL